MQYSDQISHLHLCKLARSYKSSYLPACKSSKGAENETWRCVKMNLNLDLNLDDVRDER